MSSINSLSCIHPAQRLEMMTMKMYNATDKVRAVSEENYKDVRAHFTPGGFGSFHFHRVEWDHVASL